VQDQPRRADAQRNAARVVRAALVAFEEQGTEVALEEIARRAEVGVATLYRLFGGREGLARAAFRTFFAEVVEPIARAATRADDPWDGLTTALAATVDAAAGHPVLLRVARDSDAITVDVAERFLADLGDVLVAAQRAGAARPDLVVQDLRAVLFMSLACARVEDPADRRRYLALLVAGMRPAADPLPPVSGPRDR
jgi:AcrR family transcriptional regulator